MTKGVAACVQKVEMEVTKGGGVGGMSVRGGEVRFDVWWRDFLEGVRSVGDVMVADEARVRNKTWAPSGVRLRAYSIGLLRTCILVRTSGAKASNDSGAVRARLKPCPYDSCLPNIKSECSSQPS